MLWIFLDHSDHIFSRVYLLILSFQSTHDVFELPEENFSAWKWHGGSAMHRVPISQPKQQNHNWLVPSTYRTSSASSDL